MNKIKNIVAIVIFAILVYSCGDDNNGFVNPYANLDYNALALSDNDSIVKFLKTHYYDSSEKSLKELVTGSTPMFEEKDSKLFTISVTRNEIDYKLYVYITEEGIPDFKDKNNPILGRKGNPTEVDSVFVNRTGIQLINNNIDDTPFDSGKNTWWSLGQTFGLVKSAPSPIITWVKGFPLFKSGQNVTNNGPITYNNTGKGYIFTPGGLGYPSIGYIPGQTANNSLFDQILVFKVELLDIVENTDHDNDGKPSIDEDANKDGDLTNDFSDSSNPSLPDYLNPNIK